MRAALQSLLLLTLVIACETEPEQAADLSTQFPSPMSEEERSDLVETLAEAEVRWGSAAPSDYQMVIEVWNALHTQTWELVVEDGRLVGPAEDLQVLSLSFPDLESTPWMALWFGRVHDALSRADIVRAEFDPELGYPTRIYTDFGIRVFDDEVRYVVRQFVTGEGS